VESISLKEICVYHQTIPCAKNVHQVHLWEIAEVVLHFEIHIQVIDIAANRSRKVFWVNRNIGSVYSKRIIKNSTPDLIHHDVRGIPMRSLAR
jgi:Co/Zn/Cd efflux system component